MPRETAGAAVATVLAELRAFGEPGALRRNYCERDSEWARGIAEAHTPNQGDLANLRRIEDAAYGLRWLELARERQIDLGHSLVSQIPLQQLDTVADTP